MAGDPKTTIRLGSTVRVEARPNYLGKVTSLSDHPGGKITVEPLPDQGITSRKRTVWKDKVELVTNGQ